MYAVVNIQGFQFKVEEGQQLLVNRMAEEPGQSVEIKDVLLVDQDGKVAVGKPYLDSAVVNVKVVDHLKDDKVLVFKKKRRKGFQKKNGHRQAVSLIEIESIKA
jgi:large subunit ribosomal protein L21